MKKGIYIMVIVLAIMAVALTGCTTPIPSGQTSPATSVFGKTITTGKLEITVTDAPTKEDISSIMVKIKSIEVHKAGAGEATPQPSPTPSPSATPSPTPTPEPTPDESGDNLSWIKIDVGANNEFDLLKVKDNPETLNIVPSEVGTYTQIRLEVDTVKVTFGTGDKAHTETAAVPSGKIKIIHPFKIDAGETTQLLFDFDAAQSVNVSGNGKVMFKPVIKLTSGKSNSNKPADKVDQLKFSTDKLADGKVGIAYNAALTATGGKAPYKWSITTGQLPAGLTLNQDTGVISGTATTAGESNFTAKVSDSPAEPKNATKSFNIKVSVSDLQITNTSLPAGTVGTAYAANTKLEATGGNTPYSWAVIEGTLPAGLSLNVSTGVISGTPTAAGNSNITVKVTDSSTPEAKTSTKALTIQIVVAAAS